MKRAVFFSLTLFFGMGISLVAASAADLPLGYARQASPGFCAAAENYTPSAYAPTAQAVNEHLALAVAVARSPRAMYNASPLLVWANETVNYCGFAVGFFRTNEYNQETVMQCECFYSLMRHYMARNAY
jgi:hypothetical protein